MHIIKVIHLLRQLAGNRHSSSNKLSPFQIPLRLSKKPWPGKVLAICYQTTSMMIINLKCFSNPLLS